MDVVLRALTRPGDVLAVDALSYPGIRLLASEHGLDLAPVPVTPTGPDLDALDRLCRDRPVRAVYTMPTVHNPLGWVLDRERRDRLVALARSRDCLIVEDGTYAFLDASPPPPLRTLAPERTCYVAGLSKNVAPGLRFGFAVLPGRLVEQVTRSLRAATWGTPGSSPRSPPAGSPTARWRAWSATAARTRRPGRASPARSSPAWTSPRTRAPTRCGSAWSPTSAPTTSRPRSRKRASSCPPGTPSPPGPTAPGRCGWRSPPCPWVNSRAYCAA
ncbi:aminotransferase class I/II-fold pyridoxal phosphate-dependent enzyme [Streptomyces diastatochromogenes]|nr:aminotransferase class I/II-fold pyridoxal phosphate-dependent enzyme [Streptomyces diastatochromogenes]